MFAVGIARTKRNGTLAPQHPSGLSFFPAWGSDVVSTGVYRVAVSFWPIGAAFGFAAFGAIFRYGERLQRETAGLV
ncbi:hypothetical protein ACEYYH_02590 [Microbacterium trichothecenolyticum]|uniref:hypothetical protein n=1 Tax=Microbacterium trichothecenolyticum TaxID=69370 RepID=UPI0035BE27CC